LAQATRFPTRRALLLPFAFALFLIGAGWSQAAEPAGDPDEIGPPKYMPPEEALQRANRGAEQAQVGALFQPQTGAAGAEANHQRVLVGQQ